MFQYLWIWFCSLHYTKYGASRSSIYYWIKDWEKLNELVGGNWYKNNIIYSDHHWRIMDYVKAFYDRNQRLNPGEGLSVASILISTQDFDKEVDFSSI